jgi:membrane protease YdiL (CAAX protease family)
MKERAHLLLEFLVLCILVPGIIIHLKIAPFMFSFLWGATGYCLLILRRFYHETLTDLWRWQAVNWKNLKPILIRFAFGCLVMVLFTWWYDPGRLFYVWEHNRSLIPYLLVMYPLLSALPQELIFCNFFFTRYKPYFGEGALMIFMSALVFAYAHMLYINPVAPTFSFLGGLIFASTYSKTKSLALVTIEHGLYGNALFITGLGWYFYSGAVSSG